VYLGSRGQLGGFNSLNDQKEGELQLCKKETFSQESCRKELKAILSFNDHPFTPPSEDLKGGGVD